MSLVGPSALSSLVLPGPLCGFLSWNSFLNFLFLFFLFFVLLSLSLPVPLFTPLFQDSVQIRHSPLPTEMSACLSWHVQSPLNCFSSWHLPPWRSIFCSNLLIGLSLECKLFEDKDFTSLSLLCLTPTETFVKWQAFKNIYLSECICMNWFMVL